MGLFGLFGPPDIKKMAESKDFDGLLKCLKYVRDPDIPHQAEQAILKIGNADGKDEVAKKILVASLEDADYLTPLKKMGYPALKPLIAFIIYLNLLPSIGGGAWEKIDPGSGGRSRTRGAYEKWLTVRRDYTYQLVNFNYPLSIDAIICSYDAWNHYSFSRDLARMGEPAKNRIKEILSKPDFESEYRALFDEIFENSDIPFLLALIQTASPITFMKIQQEGPEYIRQEIWKNVLYAPIQGRITTEGLMKLEYEGRLQSVKSDLEKVLTSS